jgi:hypothetical protein
VERRYEGPPSNTPPPAQWRPRRVVHPAAPRRLPPQDHAAIDAEEEQARSLTRLLGWVGGGALLLVLLLLCGRLVF